MKSFFAFKYTKFQTRIQANIHTLFNFIEVIFTLIEIDKNYFLKLFNISYKTGNFEFMKRIITLLIILVFFGCGSKHQDNGSKSVFRYNEAAGISSLDPAFAKDQSNIWACNQLFNGLVQFNDKMKISPCIAKSWKISDDGKTYIFLLRNDVYFHDNAIFKNNQEVEKFISTLVENNKLENYQIIDPYFAELYPLKFLDNKEKENYQLKNNEEKIILDELDLKILKELSKNGRIKLLDLSVKLNTNNTTVLYRLKKLKENKIILGNRIAFNTKQLGYNYTAILINFKTKDAKEKIKQFARSSKNTNSLILQLNKPNAIIQFFYKEEQELRKEITKLKKTLEEEKIETETIHTTEEEHINTTPFIK